jgi:glutathione S-transferase
VCPPGHCDGALPASLYILNYQSVRCRAPLLLASITCPNRNLQAKKKSNTGLVPVLIPLSPKLDIQICDSLAICEFLAESHPELPLWPKDPMLRALARSAAAEMHSGFSELRNTCPGNFVAKYTGNVPVTEKARKEVERAFSLWHEARTKTAQRLKELGEEDEGYLFGKFGIADAFYWPLLWVRTRLFWLYFSPLNHNATWNRTPWLTAIDSASELTIFH